MSHIEIFSLKSNLLQSLKQLEWSKSSFYSSEANAITSNLPTSSQSTNKPPEKNTPSLVGDIALQYPSQIVCSKEYSEKWIKSLSIYSENSLQKLSTRVPYSYKGDSLLRLILKDRIPLARATWYIKVSYLNIVYGDSNSISNTNSLSSSSTQFNKKQETDPPFDWTNTLTQFLNVQLKELVRSLKELTSSNNSITNQITSSASTSTRVKENYAYLSRLIHWQYNEGLLHSELFFSKLIDFINDIHFSSPNDKSQLHNNITKPEEICIVVTLLMEYLHDLCFSVSSSSPPSIPNVISSSTPQNFQNTQSSIPINNYNLFPIPKRLLLVLVDKQRNIKEMDSIINDLPSNTANTSYISWIKQSITKAKLVIDSSLRYVLYACPHLSIAGPDLPLSVFQESMDHSKPFDDMYASRVTEFEKLISQNNETLKNTLAVSSTLKSTLTSQNITQVLIFPIFDFQELNDFFKYGDVGRLFQRVFNLQITGSEYTSTLLIQKEKNRISKILKLQWTS